MFVACISCCEWTGIIVSEKNQNTTTTGMVSAMLLHDLTSSCVVNTSLCFNRKSHTGFHDVE